MQLNGGSLARRVQPCTIPRRTTKCPEDAAEVLALFDSPGCKTRIDPVKNADRRRQATQENTYLKSVQYWEPANPKQEKVRRYLRHRERSISETVASRHSWAGSPSSCRETRSTGRKLQTSSAFLQWLSELQAGAEERSEAQTGVPEF